MGKNPCQAGRRREMAHKKSLSHFVVLVPLSCIQNDPYMQANTDFSDLGWANAFIIFPLMLLLNDFFHFLPPGSPFTKY